MEVAVAVAVAVVRPGGQNGKWIVRPIKQMAEIES